MGVDLLVLLAWGPFAWLLWLILVDGVEKPGIPTQDLRLSEFAPDVLQAQVAHLECRIQAVKRGKKVRFTDGNPFV